ncbi:DUF1642 domain-containing protein [Streptococcus uberis]|uniref:DUF1642 domain-containing protein n=1 Tax=Streptococcus uberis TaxID=1349 RepID=UPI00378E1488
MKIEEAKDAIKVRSKAMTDINAKNSFGHIPCQQAIPVNEVINIIDKIELAPPKPVVPQFVIDWVDNSREYNYEFDEWFEYNNQPREIYEWLNPENKRQADLNALALFTLIINGPEAVAVEKEKLFTVEIPDPNSKDTVYCLFKDEDGQVKIGSVLFLETEPDDSWRDDPDMQLTEQEIRKDFEWAWRWKKEVTE